MAYAAGRNNSIRKGMMSAFGTLQAPATNLLDPRRLLGFSREAFLSFGRLKAEKVGPLARKLD
jgi:hypothetical protein